MPAYLKIGDIQGESTDRDHMDWIMIESMSSAIHRSLPSGAKDQQRSRGETTLADVEVMRKLDKSSVKLQEACAAGKYFPEVEIHFCTTVGGKQETFLIYKLKDVIVTSYSLQANAASEPEPTELVTFNFAEVEWTYVLVDPKTGKKMGSVPAKYCPGTGKAG